MTTTDLRHLTQEQLLGVVTGAIGATPADASLYLRNAHVPPVRIPGYPKRRKTPQAPLAPVASLGRATDISYADFLRIDLTTSVDIAV